MMNITNKDAGRDERKANKLKKSVLATYRRYVVRVRATEKTERENKVRRDRAVASTSRAYAAYGAARRLAVGRGVDWRELDELVAGRK